ncbi:MAG TPA: hypothetical protein VFJ16_32325 [Longimicrobium sp.]|nr:hypothetical protein [Longimicrobium sp.]
MDSLAPTPPAGNGLSGPILIAGGDTDYSLHSLRRQALTRGFDHIALFSGAGGQPTLTWDMERDRLELDGREIRPGACFIRPDVFTFQADKKPESARRAAAWYTAIAGWLLVHPEVRILNRHFGHHNNKPYQLHVARRVGLEVPFTRITNDLGAVERWAGERALVAKPVQGGAHCRELGEWVEAAREAGGLGPLIVQNRLAQPELRLYNIGGRFIAFDMRSELLDYRATNDTRIVPRALDDVPRELCDGLAALMEILGMDFGAADFKTDPETGRLLFLEINSSPMFYGFDLNSAGAVSDAILDTLASGPVPVAARPRVPAAALAA